MTFRLGLALPLTSDAPSVGALLDELIEQAVAAEQAGFDVVLVPEHHQGPRISYASPLTVCGLLLDRTTHIRVATGVLVLPSHHPLHVAEATSMLDHASAGRFVLGVGAGYQPADLAPFGVGLKDRGRRMEESLDVLRRLLREPEVTHHGESWELDAVKLRPAPLTTPNPPVWLGSWSPAGVRRAARLADGWIADPIRTTTEVTTMADRYRAAASECGRTPGEVVVMREGWLDDDDATGRQRFAELIEPVFGYYQRRGAFPEGATDFDSLATDRFVVGSAQTVREGVIAVATQTSADVVVLAMRHPGGPSHREALARIAEAGAALADAVTTTRRDDQRSGS